MDWKLSDRPSSRPPVMDSYLLGVVRVAAGEAADDSLRSDAASRLEESMAADYLGDSREGAVFSCDASSSDLLVAVVVPRLSLARDWKSRLSGGSAVSPAPGQRFEPGGIRLLAVNSSNAYVEGR